MSVKRHFKKFGSGRLRLQSEKEKRQMKSKKMTVGQNPLKLVSSETLNGQ